MKQSDRCIKAWNCINEEMNHMLCSITTQSGPSEQDFINTFQAFCTSVTATLARAFFTTFYTLFNFFFLTSLFIRSRVWKWSCVLNAVSTLISYGICDFAWLLSSTICRSRAPLSRVIGKFISYNTWKMSPRIRLSFLHTYGSPEGFENLPHLPNFELFERHVRTRRELTFFNTDLLRDALRYNISMTSFTTRAADLSSLQKTSSQIFQVIWTWI